MGHAVCYECVKDFYLKKIIADEGDLVECSVCGDASNKSFTVEQLGKSLEPIMREHYELGPEIKRFGDNDEEWWEQDGVPMSWAVQEVLGQHFAFEDEIVDAVCDAEDVWPPDGEIPFWDKTSMYVGTKVRIGHYLADWNHTLEELRHYRRFFSPAARSLFENLFDDIGEMKAWTGKKLRPVVRTLPVGTKLCRARVCSSRSIFEDICQDPFKHVGPPPYQRAQAGRMNAEGMVVFYGAKDETTALAELRSAIGNEVAVITVATTRPLRILDFSRLETAISRQILSYFQPDFTQQVEKQKFLRHLHRLISQPVVPGRESDYLITQTMAEYLAHVHTERFDGILFASAQRIKGINVALFASPDLLMPESMGDAFGIRYQKDTLKLFSVKAIKHVHNEVRFVVGDDGKPVLLYEHDDYEDEWW